jgi:RNA polymerase sigma-70 factor (ECF subfamily)
VDSLRADTDSEDLALVRAVRRGERGAMGDLLERYKDRLYGVCMRMVGNRELAADLTQDAMVKVIEGLGSFDERAKLSTWVTRVTMNVCLSKLRSEKLRRHGSLDALSETRPGQRPSGRFGGGGPVSPAASGREHLGPEGVELDEVRRRVSAALLRVTPEQRAILVLRDSRGLDYEQIAEALAVPVGTVKSRLFRARAALREAFEELGERGPRAPESAL